MLPTISTPFQHSQATSLKTPTQFNKPPPFWGSWTNFPKTQSACRADAPPNIVQSRIVQPINARIEAPRRDRVSVFAYVVSNKTKNRVSRNEGASHGNEKGYLGRQLLRASMLLTTTAQPTALAEAGTSYSHIAVKMGNNFIELEINNAVEMIFPLWYPNNHLAPHRTLRCNPAVSTAHNTKKNKYCRINGLPPNRNLMGSVSREENNLERRVEEKCIDRAG